MVWLNQGMALAGLETSGKASRRFVDEGAVHYLPLGCKGYCRFRVVHTQANSEGKERCARRASGKSMLKTRSIPDDPDPRSPRPEQPVPQPPHPEIPPHDPDAPNAPTRNPDLPPTMPDTPPLKL